MKFLLDMGLARSTVAFLRESGHDAVHLRDRGLQRVNRYTEEVLARFDAHLMTGALVSVTGSGIRVRSLPIRTRPG